MEAATRKSHLYPTSSSTLGRKNQFPLEEIFVLKVEIRDRERKLRTHSEKGVQKAMNLAID